MDDNDDPDVIFAQCRDGLCAGTFSTANGGLELHSGFGPYKARLGLQKPGTLARKLLKHVCETTSTGPADPRLLAKRPRSRRTARASIPPR